MTTFQGAVRTFGAAVKRMEREQQRQNRATARAFKQYQKEAAIASAAEAAEKYNNYMDMLQSLHKDASEWLDWEAIRAEHAPSIPIPTHDQEEVARAKLDSFQPGFLDKLFGLTKGKIRRLENAVSDARLRDQANHSTRMEAYQKDYTEWEQMQAFAKGVLAKEVKQYKEVLSYFNPFSDVSGLGSEIRGNISEDYAELNLVVKSDEVIPKYALTQTSTGKLSQKNLPVSRFNEIYQDYICSCVLKVAREACALLPIKFVVVNAVGELVNSTNGRLEEQAILSALIYPETLDKINFDQIDPSDCMRNFKHNMKFKKTEGFSSVEKINPESIL
ncbi:hypothetical protein SAMN05444410_10317 [Hydrobacter penzbergensis]|uniref:Uncharacterized protein n=1 Tax=Hydrobacter penzbergensis TaxID=1235997 RepID=A0A8X8IAA3_9BACT|nr:hypothetical protein [Hydrobacter penzbergensis]SDW46165.1 hypothetical protein SAMN05444410_10317 [Hydrobacter penzbergensis]